MSKLLPKKFGEKLDVDTHIDLVARVKAMTPQQRLERAAELLEEGRRYLPLLPEDGGFSTNTRARYGSGSSLIEPITGHS